MSFVDRLRSLAEPKNRDVATAAGGMLALLAGRKLVALALFGKGLSGLEQTWRDKHPEFQGGFAERWDEALRFYDATHREQTNRKLHIIGIPFIVVGAAGLLALRPYRLPWGVAAAAFVGGWVLNFVGHGLYEKNAPAFADDPLSFIAGPVWDFQNLMRGDGAAAETAPVPGSEDWAKAPASA